MRTIGLAAGASSAALTPSPAGDAKTARIGAPTDGTIFALDPDIPPARQRVWFEHAGSNSRILWKLDGKPLGHEARVSWLP